MFRVGGKKLGYAVEPEPHIYFVWSTLDVACKDMSESFQYISEFRILMEFSTNNIYFWLRNMKISFSITHHYLEA